MERIQYTRPVMIVLFPYTDRNGVPLPDELLDIVSGGRCDQKYQVMRDEYTEGHDLLSVNMCQGYEYPILKKTESDIIDGVREDCFTYSSMGMCSGYGSQSPASPASPVSPSSAGEDCTVHAFKGMCSGYEF